MRTESQINASRANGAKSRGPVTSDGKRNSSQNSIKHGAFAQAILLRRESQPHFDEYAQSLRDEFQPETPFEHTLVDSMISSGWRSQRFERMEKALLDLEIDQTEKKIMEGAMGADAAFDHTTTAALSFKSLAEGGRASDLLDRYKSRCDRQYLRAHRRLMEVQERRLKTPPVTGPGSAPVQQAKTDFEAPEQTQQPVEKPADNTESAAPTHRLSSPAPLAAPREIFTPGLITALPPKSPLETEQKLEAHRPKSVVPDQKLDDAPLMAAA